MQNNHELYMRRAIFLAQKGTRLAAPNPSVGAVIVCDGQIIGEGFTSIYGGAHAEVNAINSVKNKKLLSKATIYVTLEPCAHFGKTPPCASLIAQHHIPNVYVGILDVNILVAGKGVLMLQQAGCNVQVGLLEQECNFLHRKFVTYQQKQRPYVILKWAESKDGFIDSNRKITNLKDAKPNWISNQLSRQMSHWLRSNEQAILVGTNTALKDNPTLTTRAVYGENPVRIVIDKELKLGEGYYLMDNLVETIVFTYQVKKPLLNTKFVTLDKTKVMLCQILDYLYLQKIQSVIVEGGTKTLSSFIEAELWDEAWVFKGSVLFKEGIEAPKLPIKQFKEYLLDTDLLTICYNDR